MANSAVKLYKELYKEKYGIRCKVPDGDISSGLIPRHDPILVKVIERMGPVEASGEFSELTIMNINAITYRIVNNHGKESIETPLDINWTVVEADVLLEQ